MLTNRRFLVIALGLIVLINGAALASVWYNQRTSTSALMLSERELTRSYKNNAFQIRWQYPDGLYSVSQAQRDALMQGCQTPCQSKQTVFAVLELDGALYHAALEQAQVRVQAASAKNTEKRRAAQNALKELTQQSRLYLRAVGHDAGALRETFSDPAQYAIVRAEFTPSTRSEQFYGSLKLTHPRLYVTQPELQNTAQCSIQAKVSWGKQYIPWLSELACHKPKA